MAVAYAPDGSADLLMECDEEEQEIWPPLPQTAEEKKVKTFRSVDAAVSQMSKQMDTPPIMIIPLPVPPVSSSSPSPVNLRTKSSGHPQSFMVNGRVVPLLPGGGGVELKLHSHPRGSASGFTTVQVPVTLRVHSLAGTRHINTTASLAATCPPNSAAATPSVPEAGPTPIITGVVSGEAAQKVLSDHNMTFKSNLPPLDLSVASSTALQQTTLPTSKNTKDPPHSSRPAAAHQFLKGQLDPVSPPNCPVCVCQYKLITELRGFMCLCSPDIALSLKELKKKKKFHRKSRDKSRSSRDCQSSSKVLRTRPRHVAASVVSPPQKTRRSPVDFLSDPFASPPPTFSSPQRDQSDPPHGKLVILVEDFYYGSDPGKSSVELHRSNKKLTGLYRCINCPKTLRNNIELMSHMKQHVSQHGDLETLSTCPHCFRHYLTPCKLQCHLEAVHNQYQSTATCRICELDFGSEPAFLWHMKTTHKPGEMPYVCQVCDFRSSFYLDVWTHFQETHADTKHLLCQYCLRVLHSSSCYQQHFARHQKKHVFGCEKCRLHFLYIKERLEHKLLHHKTHIRPVQLSGLRPGTKVTVRTYSVVGHPDGVEPIMKVAPCPVVDVIPPPPTVPTQEAPKRRVESLGPLLTQLSGTASVSQPRCVECLRVIQDFRTHFPSLVHCSLCRFSTCCSTSYANHMINNHASCRRNPQYQSIFQLDSWLSETLKCESCLLSTCRGDLMAYHLTQRPGHCCRTQSESRVNVAQPTSNFNSITSPGGRSSGAFIPIDLLPSGQSSTQLSVKPLTSPSPLSSPPAMTIKFLGPRPQPEQTLTVSQLSAILSSLCHGVPQAARHHHRSPQLIVSWTRQLQRGLGRRGWSWKMAELVEQLLCWREKQLMVTEEFLLQVARDVLGGDSWLTERYSWTVDLMLRHELSHQPPDPSCRVMLPSTIRGAVLPFIRSFSSQIKTRGLRPHHLGCMDEFSIFIHLDKFNNQHLSAFQVSGSPEETPMFDVVLSALSDGTLLTPQLFFRGMLTCVPEGFPDNVLLESQQEGFSDQDRLQIWINKVWRPHMSASVGNQQSVLMVDVHRGHVTDAFRDALSSASTDLVVIPEGCSCRLQPLHVCLTPVLREFLQARWTQLVSKGGLEGLGLDQLALTLACWLSEVMSTLNSETSILRRSFSSVCDLQQVEDRWEAAKMITALTKALVHPPLGRRPGPELELLLMMEKFESSEEAEQELMDS
ncbi:uncharacterized protein pogza isoform X2 [Echeneis naucrates]|uniref:C2H2-type domain-containing protein n=1 Tax=Echeneis naucrates TaxID=173247 RepID=A0A665TZQ5_ECHNA|nr:pogo transposable element with ZNF domain isoform X2 [Echeneis naucrates]